MATDVVLDGWLCYRGFSIVVNVRKIVVNVRKTAGNKHGQSACEMTCGRLTATIIRSSPYGVLHSEFSSRFRIQPSLERTVAMNRNTYRCLLMLSGLFSTCGFLLQESVADDGTPLQTATDTELFPKSYGLLANEHLMYPVDMSDWPIKIDGARQLFVDDYLIASTVGLKRTVHQALKNPSDPVVVGDKPCEGGGPIFQIVRRDKASGRFRMWYAGLKRFDLPSGVSVRYPALYARQFADGRSVR